MNYDDDAEAVDASASKRTKADQCAGQGTKNNCLSKKGEDVVIVFLCVVVQLRTLTT